MSVSSIMSGRCSGLLLSAVLGAVVVAYPQPSRADLVWESYGFSSGQSIPGGTDLPASNGVGVTIGRSEFSDNDSGGSDITPGGNADFVTYQSGPLGAHTGYTSLSLDNLHNDPADYVELSLAFDQAVTDLQFSLLDVDGNKGWDDAVEVYYNGLNARDNPSILAINGSYVMLDDKPNLHGWEGTGTNAGNGQTEGNIDFDFGALAISSLTIRFFSTTDGRANPSAQEIGLSDLTFSRAAPEPSAFACMGLFTALVAAGRIRRRRTRQRPADPAS